MDIPKEIAELILTYSERYFKDPKSVELELEESKHYTANKVIENLKNNALQDRPASLKREIIDREIRKVESGINVIGKYTQWLEETSENAFDILSKELEDTKDFSKKKNGYKLLQKAAHYKFLDYLSMFELGRLNILKDEIIKLKEQIRTGKIALEQKVNPVEVPEHLKELWSIWNNADMQTLIDIYNANKDFLKPLGENGRAKRGNKIDGVAEHLSKIFNNTFGFIDNGVDYKKYQFDSQKYTYNNTIINAFRLIKENKNVTPLV